MIKIVSYRVNYSSILKTPNNNNNFRVRKSHRTLRNKNRRNKETVNRPRSLNPGARELPIISFITVILHEYRIMAESAKQYENYVHESWPRSFPAHRGRAPSLFGTHDELFVYKCFAGENLGAHAAWSLCSKLSRFRWTWCFARLVCLIHERIIWLIFFFFSFFYGWLKIVLFMNFSNEKKSRYLFQ